MQDKTILKIYPGVNHRETKSITIPLNIVCTIKMNKDAFPHRSRIFLITGTEYSIKQQSKISYAKPSLYYY